jgi:hypothetical protein
MNDPSNITTTLPVQIKFHPAVAELAPEWAIRKIKQLSAENATLRTTLIDVFGQRDALRQELDQSLRERAA